MIRAALFGLGVALAGLALPATAQTGTSETSGPALLVADQVYVTPQRTLVAEGQVEALQDGIRLEARRIEYDDATGSLKIDGPIRIEQADGSIVILADGAQMDADLQTGLIEGARLVFSQQIQMAALRMNRIEGRYTQLFKTSVTSCHICEDGQEPLWQIRARKVVHDEVERQIYFEDAQFRIRGVPVFYLPRLRVPDPTQKRANGFLLPSIRSTTELGVGVRVPYFITMGDHRDLTLIPYLSPQTRTMGFRYRQAFTTGRIAFIGALTDDDLRPNTLRGYLFGEGTFDLANNWKLGFQLETSSDEAYLTNYGITDSDRLKSEIGVQRVDRDEAVRLTGTYYETLRSDPVNQLSPSAFVNGRYARRFKPAGLGGELSLTAKGNAYQTETNVDGLGRDVARATGDAVWYDHHVFGNGVRHDWRIGAAADLFQIRNDSRFDNIVPRITPRASYRLSLPMARRDKSGGRQVIEPVIQLGWAKVFGGAVPLDESRFVEFDQGDILSLSRFPAPDAREDAATLVYGVNWARTAVSGIEAWATLAQVLRSEADPRFSKSSGLSGVGSDFLMVGQLKVSDTFWIAGRTLLDDDFDFSKTEFRARLNYRSAKFDATYTYLEADQAEDRNIPIHEVYFDGDIALTDRWSAELGTRYSLEDYRPRQAGVVFTYTTECVQLDFSLRRRFTENENVAASTSFGVSVNLIGFSGPGQQTQAPRCAT